MSNRSWRNTGRLIKYCALTVVFFVCAVLIWRIASSGDPQSMKTILVSESTYEAYVEGGEQLQMFYQSQQPITRGEDNYGFFSVTWVAFIPEADQLQIVFRYNNSTLKNVAKLVGTDYVHGRDEDVFDVSVVVNTDLTPDRESDNAYNADEYPEAVSEKRYFPTQVVSEQKNVYNYRKYIFEGISIDELSLAVFVDIYYNGVGADGETVVPDYSEDAMGTLCIYDYKSKNISRGLTSHDISALEDWKKKH